VGFIQELQEMRTKYGLRRGLRRKYDLWKNRYLFPSTESSVARQLRELGIGPGDLVLIHSAFSKIGYLKGGPQTLIDALWNVIGREGTIMMPTFPFNDPAFEYARRGVVFDVLKTPSKIGQLQEHFRTLPGSIRSLHPTHPYSASGKLAAELVADHHLKVNPFGEGTPLYRFAQHKGKCLLIGVGLKNCSPIRIVEDPGTYPVPVHHKEQLLMKVRDANGAEFEVRTLVHSLALAPHRNNDVYKQLFIDRQMLHKGRIGLADAWVLDCGNLLAFLQEQVAAGITPYSHLKEIPAG